MRPAHGLVGIDSSSSGTGKTLQRILAGDVRGCWGGRHLDGTFQKAAGLCCWAKALRGSGAWRPWRGQGGTGERRGRKGVGNKTLDLDLWSCCKSCQHDAPLLLGLSLRSHYLFIASPHCLTLGGWAGCPVCRSERQTRTFRGFCAPRSSQEV